MLVVNGELVEGYQDNWEVCYCNLGLEGFCV